MSEGCHLDPTQSEMMVSIQDRGMRPMQTYEVVEIFSNVEDDEANQ